MTPRSKYKLLGAVILIGSIVFLIFKYQVYQIQSSGIVVKMQIKLLPQNCNVTRGKYYADFSFQNKIYTKRIPVGYCNTNKIGDYVEMKYLEGREIILFPEETIVKDIIGIGVFMLVGLGSMIFGMTQPKK